MTSMRGSRKSLSRNILRAATRRRWGHLNKRELMEAIMFKKLGVPTLVLGTALTLLTPFAALARHHDRDDEARESIRHEQREHQRHFRGGYFYYGPSYTYDP